MAIRQTKKISELNALTSASLNTYVLGVDNGSTYKITLDVLEDAVVNMVSRSTDLRLDALENYTSSANASSDISHLNSFTSSQQSLNTTFTNGINARLTTSSFQSFSSSVHSEILAATNEQDLTPYVTNLVYGVLSQSVDSRIDNLETNSGSYLTSLNGTISGSSQLTSSYDERYVLSGSITQTTWDNISGKPSGLVSQSTDLSSLNAFTQSVDGRIDNLENWSSSLGDTFATDLEVSIVSSSVAATIGVISQNTGLVSTSSFNQYTASQSTSSLVDRLNSIENVSGSWITESETGSYATTGSNTFSGNQTINGSIILDNGAVIKDNSNNSISFGYLAADTNQGTQSVAIGNGAGYQNQSHGTVAIGTNAGAINQGQRAVALGSLAGTNTQGEYAIAIGNFAAPNNQASHSIVISATGTGLENTTPDSLVIAPIRNVTGSSGILQYDNSTKEVSYSDSITGYISASNGVISSSAQITSLGFISSSDSTAELNSYTESLNAAFQVTGSKVNFLGDITIYGTQSVINSQNVEISDNILYLSPTASTDNDLGIVGHYNDGTYRHAGIFMDASDGHSWKVFNGLQTETTATVDTNGTGFTLADFKAGVFTGTSFNGIINATNGVVSGSSQLTSSFDTRYTLSGSVQNIALPSNLVSSSAQITSLGFISSSQTINTSSFATTGSNTFIGSQTITGSLIVSSVAVVNGGITIPTGSTISLTSGSNLFVDSSGGITGSLSGSVFGIGDVVVFSSSVNTRINNITSSTVPDGTISGSSQLTSSLDGRYLTIGGDGVISGSSQITGIVNLTNLSATSQVSASVFVGGFGVAEAKHTVISSKPMTFWPNISFESVRFTTAGGVIIGKNGETNDFGNKLDVSGSVRFIGNTTITGSVISTQGITGSIAATNGVISGSSQLTASLDTRYAASGSGGSLPSGVISGSSQLTSSLDLRYLVTGSVTSSILQLNTFTASNANTSLNTFTSSLNVWSSSLATTGSNTFNGNQTITGSLNLTNGNIVASQITANTSSLYLTSGSNLYIQNTGIAEISGSLLVSGSTTFTGSISISSGSITMPNRPAFRVTGAGGGTTAVTTLSGSMTTIDFNQANCWDNTTGTFTAPIAGLYQVNLVCRTNSNSSSSGQIIVYKNNTGGTTGTPQVMIEWAANTTMNHAGGSTISKLAVGDTLKAVVAVGTLSFDGNDNFSVAYIG